MEQLYVASIYLVAHGDTDDECYQDALRQAAKLMSANATWTLDYVDEWGKAYEGFTPVTKEER